MSITRHAPGVRYSNVVVHNGTAYVAGQIGTAGADIATQTREVLANLETALMQAGTDKSRLLMVNIWLDDIADFDAMNAVYDAWLDQANKPARATVEGRLAGTGLRVEIAATAAV